jgi:hypothetical protein
MKPESSMLKRCGTVFGVLFVSVLLIALFGGAVTYTEVLHGDGSTTIEGAFTSFAPTHLHPALSILDLLGYFLGLGGSGALLLASVPFTLSFIAGVLLVSRSGIWHSSSRLFRGLVFAVYWATPILAVTVMFMLLYAVVIRSPTVT